MFFCRFKTFKKNVFFYKKPRVCLVVKTPSGCQCNPMGMGKWWIPCYFSLQIRIPHKKMTRIEWFMHWNRRTAFGLELSAKSVQNLRPCHIGFNYQTLRDLWKLYHQRGRSHILIINERSRTVAFRFSTKMTFCDVVARQGTGQWF